MPTIKTTVDDATYATLVDLRKRKGVPSVSALFLSQCGVLTDQKEATEIVRRAIASAKKKTSGPRSQYKLQDLFPKTQWTAFSKPARIIAGKMFKAKIEAENLGIQILDKSSSNHQYYTTV